MGMYSDVDRLKGILKDLAGLVNEPNSLPDATRDYINVCVWRERGGEGGREGGREREGGSSVMVECPPCQSDASSHVPWH